MKIELIETYESKDLWQWDVDRQIKIECDSNETVEEVHFSNVYTEKALIVTPKENEAGELIANIPNILLTHAVPIDVYIAAGRCTKNKNVFDVHPRKKPSDYVYTETETKNYDLLEKRIEALENNAGNGGSGGITKETDPTVPKWAKEPEKPKYTAEEVGAASKEEFNKLSEEIEEIKENAPTVDDILNALPTWQGGAY